MTIKWNKLAIKQLTNAIQYLEDNDLLGYADKIDDEIFEKIDSLIQKSHIHEPDRFKKRNDGTFYAFEIDHYRISYRRLPREIRILRVRHTSRRPFTR